MPFSPNQPSNSAFLPISAHLGTPNAPQPTVSNQTCTKIDENPTSS
jgi:hypothetical protein